MAFMRLHQRLLKMFSPQAENARMDMRAARCRAEATAEDLTRTMTLHEDEIKQLLREGAHKVNGGKR